jgi:hypothetical protein
MTDDPLAPPATRPLWLVTLADLALLLVGFFVLMQANRLPPQEIARGLAEGFGVEASALPVEAQALRDFSPGSAAPPDTQALVAWARTATRDPRVALTVTGATDGSPADRVQGSAALLAADRARAVAAALAQAGVTRTRIATDARPAGRHVIVTLAFAGEEGNPK